MSPILREENESFLDFHIRLFANKDTYELDTYQIADLLIKNMEPIIQKVSGEKITLLMCTGKIT
jgi:hypothetical protein